ncbi:galactoside 2-alpha-L-fucosyltransferase-like [Wolffia australiana]
MRSREASREKKSSAAEEELAMAATPPEKWRTSGKRKMLTTAFFMASCLAIFSAFSLFAGVRRHASPPMQQLPLLLLPERPPADQIGFEVQSKKSQGGFDEKGACLSRQQSSFYRRSSSQKKLSYHLQKKLKNYEALHRKCGPTTDLYRETSFQLRSNHSLPPSSSSSECKYLVWISYSGLGNRILTLASAFLYALLTGRVLLVDGREDMASLFCEPFPGETWLLPSDFPLLPLEKYNSDSSFSLGSLSRVKFHGDGARFVYLHLAHDYSQHDKLFFCQREQHFLGKVPWLLLRSDNYFLPSLFLVRGFQRELELLFPEKELVFHHLGRYLFHPANPVWGLITRFYHAYLAEADEKVGIQIRVFEPGTGPFPHVMDQVLACVLNQKLLPKVKSMGDEAPDQRKKKKKKKKKKKVVLVTSLSWGYYEKMRSMYWEGEAEGEEVVSVHQPSHEEHQKSGDRIHLMKAWAEMYLLSLTDVLVTSAWSTFGYVAQGLSGVRPWILVRAENRTMPDPPCLRARSMEPCFHAPPFYDCEAREGVDTGAILPHLRHCEDVSWGLKLFDPPY